MPDNEQRRLERYLLNYLDEAEAAGHPYPEIVAIERFMKTHGPQTEVSDGTT